VCASKDAKMDSCDISVLQTFKPEKIDI